MIGFFSACLNRQLAKARADQARLHIDLCTARADNDWLIRTGRNLLADKQKLADQLEFLADENAALHRSLAAAVENNRRLGIALFESVGHPSVRASVAKRAEQN